MGRWGTLGLTLVGSLTAGGLGALRSGRPLGLARATAAAGSGVRRSMAAAAGGAGPVTADDAFVAFLRRTKADAAAGAGAGTYDAAIGNEAADADSIISAVCYSYVREALGLARGAPLPLVSVPRSALRLRAETNALLRFVGISAEDLTCMDEVDLGGLAAAGRLQLALLDHNALAEGVAYLADSVYHIVDHHRDAGKHPGVAGELRTVAFDEAANDGMGTATVGSTCSLVVEAAAAGGAAALPRSMAALLYGVILLDTANMNPAAGKGTPRDAAALQVIEDLYAGKAAVDVDAAAAATAGFAWPSRGELFSAIQEAKFDPQLWRSLTALEAITYDYKQFTADASGRRIGIATVLTDLDSFVGPKADLLADAKAYLEENRLDVLGIMFSWLPGGLDGEMQRQLLLMGPVGGAVGPVAAHLTREGQNKFSFSPISVDDESAEAYAPLRNDAGLEVYAFDQGLRKASRKQVAPALLEALDATAS